MRKFFLFLLLLSGWAVIFSPWLSGESVPSLAFSPQAHPSNQPMPKAWQNTQRIPVHIPAEGTTVNVSPTALAQSGSRCGGTYTIQNGDALGKIAQKCGVTLANLLKANPKITNPDRIYPGQPINLPSANAGQGRSSSQVERASSDQPGELQPGTGLEIDASGLPPNTTARIGLGLSSSGYVVLGEHQTDASGRLAVNLALPEDIRPGESAFIMITTLGSPTVQRTSETFVIGQP